MPAMNKLSQIMQAGALELVMVDATHARFVDLYCNASKESYHTESDTESDTGSDRVESESEDD